MEDAIQIINYSFLSDETLEDIFSRLPVKTLLRFKCLCKRYCTLISSPCFISLHLKRFNSHPDNHYIFVQNGGKINRLIRIQNPARLIKFTEEPISEYTVIGSINGLVCLCADLNRRQFICLWNPSINQFKILPIQALSLQERRKCDVSMGFGYERSSDDYKFMRVLTYDKETIVDVYSTKLECWEKFKHDVRLKMKTCRCDVIVEGFTYWVATDMDDYKKVIAVFDLRRETFIIFPVPERMTTLPRRFRATNYQGSFALLVYAPHRQFKASLALWKVEHEGYEYEWQRQFTIGMGFTFSWHWGLTNGDIVVENAPNTPYLFNMRTKEMKVMTINPLLSVFNYTPSLVSINGFRRVHKLRIVKRRNAS